MKKVLTTVACLLLLVGCKKETKQVPELSHNLDAVAHGAVSLDELGTNVDDEYAALYGVWEGYIGTKEDAEQRPVIMKIKGVEGGIINAYITIDGKRLNIAGKQETKDGKLFMRFKQGSNKYEKNIFELWYDGDKLAGTYTAKAGEEVAKTELAHRPFSYSPSVMPESSQAIDWENPKKINRTYIDEEGKEASYTAEGHRHTSKGVITINASVQKLTEEQLKNLRKIDLEIIRNTIYARHGYAFQKSYLRNFFNNTEWYVPVSNNVEGSLTKLEQQNIVLLKRMEKYATDHYEYFGR